MAQSTPLSIDLSIHGMTCASCVRHVERALTDVPGVAAAFVNLANAKAHIVFTETAPPSLDALKNAVTERGFSASLLDDNDISAAQLSANQQLQHESKRLKNAFILAAVLSAPVFITDMGSHLLPGFSTWLHGIVSSFHIALLQCVLTTLVLFIPGRRFFSTGVPALWHFRPDMNSLVALGAGSAWLYSLVATFAPQLFPQGSAHLYYEAAAVVVTLLLLGRYFEARAKGNTSDAVSKLIHLQSHSARVQRNQQWLSIPIDHVQVGDHVLVRPGESIPIDGVIVEGSSQVNEAMVTGESLPVQRDAGDAVIGGSINTHGSIILQCTHTSQHSTLANIIRMVEHAQATRLPVQNLVNQITLWFVPAVMFIALLSFVLWVIYGPEPSLRYALTNAVAVLIVACPCAMGLAVPTSIMVATGRAAQLGLLFRDGDALQNLNDSRIVAFDKTGTLTLGKPTLQHMYVLDAKQDSAALLVRLAAIQEQSEHPIGHAIVQAAKNQGSTPETAQHVMTRAGHGIEGYVQGIHYQMGSKRILPLTLQKQYADLIAKAEAYGEQGASPVYVLSEGKLVAYLTVADAPRPEAKEAIQQLHRAGIQTAMITGDVRATAEHIATQLGIAHCYAEQLPEQKVETLAELETKFGKLCFVGDGINDAPALAQASVGIAVGAGTDIAIEAADVVLMNNDIRNVSSALRLSRATLRNIQQNLFWAFAYNTALIPLAAGGLYLLTGELFSPIYSAIAMALSSVFVVLNALRLRHFQ